MLGRNHLLVNAAVAAAASGVIEWGLSQRAVASMKTCWTISSDGVACLISTGVEHSATWLGLPWQVGDPFSMQLLPSLAMAVLLYLLGSLAPDIDQHHSLLGRWFTWLPCGPHRGLTHSMYVLLGMVALVVFIPTLRLGIFFVAGFVLHVLVDVPSQAGWAPWWPLNLGRRPWRLIATQDGSMVVRDGGVKLYRVGQPSETALMLAITMPLLMLAGWLLWPALSGLAVSA